MKLQLIKKYIIVSAAMFWLLWSVLSFWSNSGELLKYLK